VFYFTYWRVTLRMSRHFKQLDAIYAHAMPVLPRPAE